MVAVSVVVLPAPLRPSRHRISPSATEKLTDCSACEAPYQAESPSTSSIHTRAAPARRGAASTGAHPRPRHSWPIAARARLRTKPKVLPPPASSHALPQVDAPRPLVG